MMAYFTLTCWGCNKTESCEYTDWQDSLSKTHAMEGKGWRRRTFGPNADPWFCSRECAFDSYHAKTAEKWWKERIVKMNDKKNRIHIAIRGLEFFALFCLIAIIAVVYSVNH